MSTKDRIRETNDLTDVSVPCPEWDCTLTVRSPTVAARAAIIERHRDADTGNINFGDMQMSMVLSTVIDPDDESGTALMFTDEDRDWLQEKNASVMERLFKAGLQVSGMVTPDGDMAYEGSEAPSEIDLGKGG